MGDAKDTIPIPGERHDGSEDGSVRFENFEFIGDKSKWLDYASERLGRFVGLENKDGSTKTECGIHVAGAEQTFDRDLWSEASKVIELSKEDASTLKDDSIMVVYAPWCQFCQAMEDEYEKLAGEMDGMVVTKFRGDEEREFVSAEFDVKSFPTILVKKGGKLTKYESEDRDVAALKAFATSA